MRTTRTSGCGPAWEDTEDETDADRRGTARGPRPATMVMRRIATPVANAFVEPSTESAAGLVP